MKLETVLANKNRYSDKASDAARQLAFAGVAVVWLLREGATNPPLPPALVQALTFFVGALALDILQYAVASLLWTVLYKWKEFKRVPENKEFLAPSGINFLPYLFFFGKILAVLLGYTLLILHVVMLWGLFGVKAS